MDDISLTSSSYPWAGTFIGVEGGIATYFEVNVSKVGNGCNIVVMSTGMGTATLY
jgi:phage shock protein PspC (stress-responsive transcriptional regulator)